MSTTGRSWLRALPLLVCAPLLAQERLSQLGSGLLPFQGRDSWTYDVAAGDVDGDGDRDLVLAAGEPVLYLNDGGGAFAAAPAGWLPATDGVWSVVLGDVDGDGDLDLCIGRSEYPNGAQNALYLGDGRGRFVDVTGTHLPAVIDATNELALCDVDGDSDLDLVVANSSHNYDPPIPQRNRLHLNDGTGRFTDVTATQMPNLAFLSASVAVADFDGDGDPDLVFGNAMSFFLGLSGQDRLYQNDGRGRFTDMPTAIPLRIDSTYDVLAIDVEGDSDIDLILAAETQNLLLLNDGIGRFTDVTAARLPGSGQTWAVASADVDGDGDPDVVLARFDYQQMRSGLRNELWLNDGRGFFADATAARMSATERGSFAVLAEDLDADGTVDLYFGNAWGQDSLDLNDGTGRFLDLETFDLPEDPFPTLALALGDVDGDGDLDLATGNLDMSSSPPKGLRNQLLRNDGKGGFVDASANLPAPNADRTRALVLADLDGDSDLDQFLGNWGQNRLWLNSGTGVFVDATGALPADNDETSGAAAGDVDGDGDLDLVLASGKIDFYAHQMVGRQNRLYLNAGATFQDATQANLPVDSDATAGVALGDVDGDGDLDVVFANMGVQNRLHLNDGSGRFTDGTAGRLPADSDHSRAAVLGDVDGDGDLDLLFANGQTDFPQQDRLALNDGRGTFTDVTATHMPQGTQHTHALVLADIDLDGRLDILRGVGYPGVEPVALLRNLGAGVYAAVARTSLLDDSRSTDALAAGDVDGDGDPDVVAGNQYRPNRLLRNLHRHLHTPLPARIARAFDLDVFASPGLATGLQIALPLLGFVEQRPGLPLPPLGVLGLSPGALLPLPTVGLPAPGGRATVRLTFPRVPALLGATLYTQVLITSSPRVADWRLTNVRASTVRR